MEAVITNSLGMRLVRIEAGTFTMGSGEAPLEGELGPLGCPDEHPRDGDYDEFPPHEVTISKPFHMGATQVTNAQYDQFDPGHRELRGKLGFSTADDEAVVFVSWHDAVRFCQWLSKKEGRPYRLPTEAEWEYACRAGATTLFNTGQELPEPYHKNNRIPKWEGPAWYPDARGTKEQSVVSLTVGRTPPNAWGLHDMHGNVEEWCLDWYGPYEAGPQTDPVGRADGEFRVTRGGSHSTDLYFLRSANRLAALPEDKHWLIGFRVVMGEMPRTAGLPDPPASLCRREVRQDVPKGVEHGPDPREPYFRGPRRFVKVPPNSWGPMYSRHNHDTAIAECPNGDLLAVWYSCIDEPGRELCLLASRLRYGQEEWDTASPFWDVPDRNSHAPALWFDGDKTLHNFVGVAAGGTWGSSALVMRSSTDSGATWSKGRLIAPEHGAGIAGKSKHMPVESVFRTREGTIVLPCDADDGTSLHLSRDDGRTWEEAPGLIAGIHAGVVQLADGRLMALGRGGDIDGHMPMSISEDMGATWSYKPSPFPSLTLGQRLVLKRLKEGPLFFASFAGPNTIRYREKEILKNNGDRLTVTDSAGRERKVQGLFAALSFDEGLTWPIRKLITPGGPPRALRLTYDCTFTMDAETAEPQGYLSACQARSGVIHLITSHRHYAFNLAWLMAPMPGEV